MERRRGGGEGDGREELAAAAHRHACRLLHRAMWRRVDVEIQQAGVALVEDLDEADCLGDENLQPLIDGRSVDRQRADEQAVDGDPQFMRMLLARVVHAAAERCREISRATAASTATTAAAA